MTAMASEQLTQKYICVGCHEMDKKVVGPSWLDIRSKYKDGSATAAQLAKAIGAGSTGKWGSIPMPAQSTVADADAQALATWILKAQ
jgi:cytochrome c